MIGNGGPVCFAEFSLFGREWNHNGITHSAARRKTTMHSLLCLWSAKGELSGKFGSDFSLCLLNGAGSAPPQESAEFLLGDDLVERFLCCQINQRLFSATDELLDVV